MQKTTHQPNEAKPNSQKICTELQTHSVNSMQMAQKASDARTFIQTHTHEHMQIKGQRGTATQKGKE